MQSQYVTYKKFPDAREAMALQHFLIENGIESLFADTSPGIGSAMTGDYGKEYEVQLKPEQFEAADQLLESYAESMIGSLPEDYYLLSFTDEELYEVVLKHDEWNEFDYVLARRLLAGRGKPVDEAEIQHLRQKRMEDLAKPETDQSSWVWRGYGLALAGGFFGVITGYVLWTSKKTLPNGQVVPMYSDKDRMHGKIILFVGILVLILTLLKILLYSDN
ncbi:hypothetical protein OGH69_00780 [Flavobacterium sp. MFBS3-15]|uniref:hypothetical protein n=1 Tax=Flavobacterium sp. MFBS3-15 TaxID=2989816 RepID=UPI0022365D6D|nr:hypothetical protein [Flavobacterium sp. MFBS3-15]MCW4467488.1 hypothetical protein [Flavobacterium sp. MFBS3-15]